MATIYIDNKPYTVDEGQDLLTACLSLGFDLPYFCWHPAMHSVGACRQCAIKQFKDEHDKTGRIVMSCMTPVKDGLRISIDDPEARAFRTSVIEWLMTNHPHDCPVCDEGGECHLQDMTLMTGHTYRRYNYLKRTYRNQDLGPFLTHEMNRCIQCYRCVRFYRDFAGGRDFDVLGWHDRVYFGRSSDGVLENEFAGNLVEICPTGVFTDKTLKEHYTRKWDLQTAPSVCVHCGLGCNTIPGERYGSLRRVHNRFNSKVNGYFLCDRGRYGYEFVNRPERLREASDGDALADAVACLAQVLSSSKVIGIGSPRASLEANYALRQAVGAERFFAGLSQQEFELERLALNIMQTTKACLPSLLEVEQHDAAFILGEDVTNVAPMLAYEIRQLIRQKGLKLADQLKIDRWNDYPVREVTQKDYSPVFIACCDATKLDNIAARAFRLTPDDIARLGFAVAAAIAGEQLPANMPAPMAEQARRIAEELIAAERPLVISGPSCGSKAVMQAAAATAEALCAMGKPAGLLLTTHECNTRGLMLMDQAGAMADAAEAIQSGAAEAVIVLENDLYRRGLAEQIDAMLAKARHVVVIDHTRTRTADRARLVLPAATFAECTGTFVNNEGRAQRFYQVFPAQGVRPSWLYLRNAMVAAGELGERQWLNVDDLQDDMARQMPVFAPVPGIAPPADFRVHGMKVPRQPGRYSGRTAMTADATVHEPQPAADPDSPLAFTMEGFRGQPPAPLVLRYWAGGWNSVQALNKFQQEVGGPLRQQHCELPFGALRAPSEVEGRNAKCELLIGRPAASGQAVGNVKQDGVPPVFQARQGQWLIVPAYHIFGSEELSALTSGVASLAPTPYIGMNVRDAAAIGVREGEMLAVILDGVELQAPLRIRPALPDGLAVLPVGLAGMPYVPLPAWGRLSVAAGKADATEGRP